MYTVDSEREVISLMYNVQYATEKKDSVAECLIILNTNISQQKDKFLASTFY